MTNDSSKPVKCVAEYLERVNKLIKDDGTFVFRGQSNSSYSVDSSATRRIRFNTKITKPKIEFVEYNKQLIEKAKMKGYHQKGKAELKDLELLAELQHNGAATCLIDFTHSSLIALFFSCTSLSKNDGAVYVTNIQDRKHFVKISSHNLSNSIEDLLQYSVGKPFVWEPSDINSRIPIQHSVFIFGELEIHNDCFKPKIIIDGESKSKILEELKKVHNFDGVTLFSDLPGFAKTNPYNKPYILSDYVIIEKGTSALLSGKNELAQHYFEQIEDSNDLHPYIRLGIVKKRLGDYEGSIKECDKLISIHPDVSSYYVYRGIVKCRQRDFLGAIKDYDIAIKLEDDLDEASVRDGITLEPDMDEGKSYYCRGIAKSSLSDYDGAIDDLKKAYNLNYDHDRCNYYLNVVGSNRAAEIACEERMNSEE